MHAEKRCGRKNDYVFFYLFFSFFFANLTANNFCYSGTETARYRTTRSTRLRNLFASLLIFDFTQWIAEMRSFGKVDYPFVQFSQGRALSRGRKKYIDNNPPAREDVPSPLPCWKIGRWTNGNDFLPRHLVPTGAWVHKGCPIFIVSNFLSGGLFVNLLLISPIMRYSFSILWNLRASWFSIYLSININYFITMRL